MTHNALSSHLVSLHLTTIPPTVSEGTPTASEGTPTTSEGTLTASEGTLTVFKGTPTASEGTSAGNTGSQSELPTTGTTAPVANGQIYIYISHLVNEFLHFMIFLV